jgi:hypothetical protein
MQIWDMLRLWRPGPDGVFAAMYTIGQADAEHDFVRDGTRDVPPLRGPQPAYGVRVNIEAR